MKKLNKIFSLLVLLISFAASAYAADSFYVKSIDAEAGKTTTLDFILENEIPYYGFQAEVTLPAGMTMRSVALTQRADDNWTLEYRKDGDALLIVSYSTSHAAITGRSGALMKMVVDVDSDFKGGSVKISNIIFVNDNSGDVKFGDSTSEIGLYVPVEEITLNTNSLNLEEGETAKLTAAVTPENATDKTLTWTSSDAEIAKVENGEVTAVKAGTAIITVTSSNGISATCTVTVTTPLPEIIVVTAVTLNTTSLNLEVGETATLTATVAPESATNKSLTWTSSDAEIAKVENGVVTAVKAGTATIIVTSSNDKSATCTVTVTTPEPEIIVVTAVTLNTNSLNLEEGETATLTATVAPANATDKTLTWTSSDPEIAKVENGVVTAIKAGTAIITVTSSNGKSATCTVTVTTPEPEIIEATSVSLNTNTLSLEEGETATLTATVAPANATDKSLTWTSSDVEIAKVENGVVTAVKAGTAIITVTSSNGKSATCTVTVPTPQPEIIEVSSVTLNTNSLNLEEGETATLTATVAPENATNKTLTWTSSDAEIAKVENGVVTAVKAGTATITVTSSNGKSATCTVTVTTPQPEIIEVTSVTLNTNSLDLEEGETATLTATVAPENATNKSLTWTSSDAEIAKVENGVVTAIKEGTATITVTSSNGKSATCTVTVTTPEPEIIEVTAVTLNTNSLNLEEGETATLTATVAPENATNKSLTWTSSDVEIAKVENGVVTAIKAGTVTITVTSINGKTATCTVTVTAPEPEIIEVTSVTLNTNTLDLEKGKTATLIASVAPANATDKTLTWASSDPQIAKVENGVVTAVKEGAATITVTSNNGKSATCTVTVTTPEPEIIEVTSVTLNTNSLNLEEGETATLTATVAPENATNKSLTWTSSDAEIAKVENGVVTAIKAGTATITVTSSNGKTDTCTVTVTVPEPEIIEVTSVTLNTNTLDLEEGKTATLIASVAPENATDKTLTWTSSDTQIAKVENGVVTAIKEGTATITVTSSNGKSAICTVTVTTPQPEIIEVTSVTLNTNSLDLEEGETATLTATVAPEIATNKTLTWTSSDAEIAKVENGVVTAIKAGTATITVTSSNGKTDTCTVTVTAPEPEIIEVTSVTLNTNTLDLEEGKTATLIASVAPENATDKTLTWTSSDAEIAKVENGVVTAVKAGTATITVTSNNGKSATCTVTVTTPEPEIIEVTSVTLNTNSLNLEEGETATLTTTVAPENATNKTLTWTSSDAEIAKVENGVVTAIKAGTATITVTSSNGKTDTCTINVTIPEPEIIEVTSVTLNTNSLDLKEGETATLIATVAPENASDRTLTWTSSDVEIAKVENGVVTAVKAGTATITVTSSNGKSATCTVKVTTPQPEIIEVASVTLNTNSLDLEEGETATLTATVAPENATNKTLTWTSSDVEIAKVENGVVTAVKEGTATITVTSTNGKTASCIVIVSAPEPEIIEVTSVTLNTNTLDLEEGKTATLIASVAPENATDKTLTWTSSDAEIAKVDNGVVTAVKAGTATITVTSSNGKSATCTVTVTIPQPEIIEVTSVTLNTTSLDLEEGETATLTATVAPENATNKSLTWTSSDAEIAKVENGVVTAVKAGTATITVTSINGKTATCTVTVTTPEPEIIEVTAVTLNTNSLDLKEGETATLIATVAPENATDRTLTWTSSDVEIAKVENGVVTAVKAGTATITVTSINGKTATCTVTVTTPEPEIIEVTSVTLNTNSLSLAEGETATLTVTVLPMDATDKNVTWHSSDDQIVNVNDGFVTGVKPGTAIVIATSSNGMTATCNVIVKRRPLTPTQLLRKGDGSTCTFITMMDIPDSELDLLGYKFVVGFNDAEGISKIIAETSLRYCHTTPEIYNDPSNDFWVFAYIVNNQGEIENSNLRHLDGREEVCFDTSKFGYPTKGDESSVLTIEADQLITVTPSGLRIAGCTSDAKISIFTLTGEKIYSESLYGNNEIELSQFTAGTYIVIVNCAGKTESKKIVVR